ncbi:chemotaxis protein CheR [Sphingomonas suaedae]|uniref:Chemotaxis protein CheR n=1 Tax=Sphingomonas suaedae TaxID=2599297 RepID=A0A518RBQ6_9SPHN|nr:CheR family methyltransferase [Sphingomonas suaedae]QDX24878.1 chemotaxis protein CheR [Sphingomonas suaedae]
MSATQPLASPGAINVIGALLEQRTGQQIAANRIWRIETALKTVLREHGLETADALIARLTGAADGALADAVIDALLNRETSFFRDTGVLEMLVEAAASLQAEQPGRRLRIWSAGCSTGQEPYSLAMLFEEAAASRGVPMPEIIATDVSAATVARARAGRFTQFEIQRGLPVRRMVTWFDQVGEEWVVRPDLARRIQFRRHNLTQDRALVGKFDIVLCRNVLFYFPPAMRARAYATLREAIRDGGFLLLGAGETVIGQTDAFVPCMAFRGLYRAEPASELRIAVGSR